MKQTGAKQPNQMVLWGVLGAVVLGCVVYIYNLFSTPTLTTPPPAPVASVAPAPVKSAPTVQGASSSRPIPGVKENAALNLGSVGQYDPALHMEAMDVTESLAYAGSGRNIFSASSAPPPPTAIPKPVAPVRPEPTSFQQPVPQGPPPPPPIDLKFFGTSTAANGKRRAFLLHGEDVYLAVDGEIVGRRYKVVTVGTNSVVVEDMPNSNRQTIPLEAP